MKAIGTVGVFCVMAVLSGCTQTLYVKDGLSQQEIAADEFDCKQKVLTNVRRAHADGNRGRVDGSARYGTVFRVERLSADVVSATGGAGTCAATRESRGRLEVEVRWSRIPQTDPLCRPRVRPFDGAVTREGPPPPHDLCEAAWVRIGARPKAWEK